MDFVHISYVFFHISYGFFHLRYGFPIGFLWSSHGFPKFAQEDVLLEGAFPGAARPGVGLGVMISMVYTLEMNTTILKQS